MPTDVTVNNTCPLVYEEKNIRIDERGLMSLNDMWHAVGEPKGKLDPRLWGRSPRPNSSGATGERSFDGGPGREFIEFIAEKLNVAADHIYFAKRGRYGGGTWAHWQIAIAYAKYLSPEFHAWANQVVRERIEEDRTPELGITRSRERAIANWKRAGKSDEYIQARLKGIEARHGFTDTLKEHGVIGSGYGICTNNIYRPIIGGSAAEVRQRRGLPQKANVRESMSAVELAGMMFAEILASDRIARENRQGTNSCAAACLKSSLTVSQTIDAHERSIGNSNEPEEARDSPLTRRMERVRQKAIER